MEVNETRTVILLNISKSAVWIRKR